MTTKQTDFLVQETGRLSLRDMDFSMADSNVSKRFGLGCIAHRFISRRSNGPALKYQIAVCIETGDIVSYDGPLAGGSYINFNGPDSDFVHEVRNRPHERAKVALRALARHESITENLHAWGALKQKWRHSVQNHDVAFRSILVITQLVHEKFPAKDQACD